MNKNSAYAAILATTIALAAPVTDAEAQHNRKAKNIQTKTVMSNNPLINPSILPYGAPDFATIKPEHFLPAIQEGIRQQKEEIEKIVNNTSRPTFANTVLAYERSGLLLDRVNNIFGALLSADKTPAIADAERQIVPLMTEWENTLSFNEGLFRRIKFVYQHDRKKYKGEDLKLLDEQYRSFVRAGAELSPAKKVRMMEINKRMAQLQQDFSNMLTEATNEATVWINDETDLDGLSQADIAQCKKDAESRGG